MPIIISKLMPTYLEVNKIPRECCTVDVKVVLTPLFLPASNCHSLPPKHLVAGGDAIKGTENSFQMRVSYARIADQEGRF